MAEQKPPTLHITPDGGEVTYRTGDALPVREPRALSISGNIDSPGNYYAHHKDDLPDDEQYIDKKTAVVTVNYPARTIILEVNPKNAAGKAITVSGKLNISPDLKDSQIYSGKGSAKEFDRLGLVKFLKFNKRFFAESEGYPELLAELRSLKLDIIGGFKQESDDRANYSYELERTVKSKLPERIEIKIRVFDGFPAVAFMCEVNISVSGNEVSFWLECVTMEEYIETQGKLILDAEVARLSSLYTIKIG